MFSKYQSVGLLLAVILSSTAWSEELMFVCPVVSEVKVSAAPKDSWAPYQYQATTEVQGSTVLHTIHLAGMGYADSVAAFYAANWSDHILLCNYHAHDGEAIVLAEQETNPDEMRCTFKRGAHVSDCKADDPAQCQMWCEVETPPL